MEYPTVSSIAQQLSIDASLIEVIDKNPGSGLVMISAAKGEEVPDSVNSTIWALVDGKTVRVMSILPRPTEIISEKVKILDGDLGFQTDTETITSQGPIVATIGIEGFYVRLGRFRGYDIFANRKKIDASKSTWGDANFRTEYEKAGGPSHDFLFEDTFSSALTYSFMVTTQPTITGTRQILSTPNSGYVTFLGRTVEWEAGTLLAYEQGQEKEYGGSVALPRFVLEDETIRTFSYETFPGKVEESLGLLHPVTIPASEISTFLEWGYFDSLPADSCPDPRMQTGESVSIVANGKMYKIVHPSYAWRNELRRGENGSGDPKLMNPFYRAVISNFKSQEEYNRWFLPIQPLPIKNIVDLLEEDKPVVWIPPSDMSDVFERFCTNTGERRRISFVNFLLSVPPHSQKEVVKLWSTLDQKLHALTKYILGIQKDAFHFVNTDKDSTEVTRLATTDESAEKARKEGHTVARGMNNWYYIIDKVKCPEGKKYVLLSQPHPSASRIANLARKEALEMRDKSSGDKKRGYNYWNLRAINRLVDRTEYSYVYQMIRQLSAVQEDYFEQK